MLDKLDAINAGNAELQSIKTYLDQQDRRQNLAAESGIKSQQEQLAELAARESDLNTKAAQQIAEMWKMGFLSQPRENETQRQERPAEFTDLWRPFSQSVKQPINLVQKKVDRVPEKIEESQEQPVAELTREKPPLLQRVATPTGSPPIEELAPPSMPMVYKTPSAVKRSLFRLENLQAKAKTLASKATAKVKPEIAQGKGASQSADSVMTDNDWKRFNELPGSKNLTFALPVGKQKITVQGVPLMQGEEGSIIFVKCAPMDFKARTLLKLTDTTQYVAVSKPDIERGVGKEKYQAMISDLAQPIPRTKWRQIIVKAPEQSVNGATQQKRSNGTGGR
jgi:hypothetical protein